MSRIKNISSRFIESVCTRLNENKQVRRFLPEWGRLHIDRQLPFLCIYRKPDDQHNLGTDRLLMGQASYLLALGNKNRHRELSDLVFHVVHTLVKQFGTFLIVEIWTKAHDPKEDHPQSILQKPGFQIYSSYTKKLFPVIETLEKRLKTIRIRKLPADVEVIYNGKYTPPLLKPLLSKKIAKELNCSIIGLEIHPIYWNSSTGETYPMIRRMLLHKLTYVFLQAFYTFSSILTSSQPTNFHTLGRRSMVKAVWETDRQLAAISNSFDFLLQVTPINSEKAWGKFKRHKFQSAPVFHYRPLAVTPVALKREIWNIPIEKIEDPAIAILFRQKRSELDMQISMFENVETSKFLYGSLQLYGKISVDLYKLAQTILERVPRRIKKKHPEEIVDAQTFAHHAEEEIACYNQINQDFIPVVEIRDDITGLMVSHGNLLVSNTIKVTKSRIVPLLQHEIGTHLLTYYNGKAQPFKLLKSGLAGYDALQEGLAVLAEFLVGGLDHSRLRVLAARVIAAATMVKGASFVETFHLLNHDYGINQRTAFSITVRIYRGGGFIKDMVYLQGLVDILDYLKNNSNLDILFIGKIGVNHIPIVQELLQRKVLKPAPFQARYLSFPQVSQRLELLRKGTSVMELITGGRS